MSIKNESKKNNFNKLIFVIISVIIIAFVIIAVAIGLIGNDVKNNSVSSNIVSSDLLSSEKISENEQSSIISSETETSSAVSSKIQSSSTVSSKTYTSSSLAETNNIKAYLPNNDWKLIIANKQHPLPKSYVVNVSYVSGNYRLDSRITEAYNQMVSAAKNDGIKLVIISGFRTYSGQQKLFNNKVAYFKNQGYSAQKAEELAAQYVAPPGTSEHLTGLAADLISSNWYSYNSDLNDNFEKTNEFKWLYSHCAEYGFILRYPKGKENITGYSYEPWHYRYVGKEAAKIIMDKGICLEEYAQSLS